MDDHEEVDSFDTQTSETDAIGMGNLFPQPTRTYSHQPQGQPGQPAPGVGQQGLNTFANQPTVQAQPPIYPIFPQAPLPAAPPVAQPVAPQPITTQGTTLPGVQQAPIAVPRRQPRSRPSGGGAAVISVLLGIITVVMGALPVCGIVAVLPGLIGVGFGWQGMRTRYRNLAILGMLLAVGGIALAFALVV